ncbi:MAG: SCP2 sterol-binding domain-containing protein [Firmicutes bacterium]|nr:SCP2 sterol-binding domain-containing protein [Bacillota bacterium]
MTDEKTLKPAVKAEEKTTAAAKKPAEKKVKKPAEKKAAAAKPAAAKKAAAKPAAAKKTAAKPAAKKAAKTVSLDDLTTALWKKLEKKDVKSISCSIAIQVNVYDVGTFYVAVNANPEFDKQIIQSDYYLADGILETKADEIKKIAAGKYDFLAAAKTGKITYRGDLSKAITVAELFK